MKHGRLTVELPNEATWGGLRKAHVTVAGSNTRWCSDDFDASCDDGDKLRVTFALDWRA